jgi:glucan phosphoethanolaminetransferase (alkaline phosphatase superfamily)
VIVLHLYGSHEPSCVRFPANQAVLHGGSEADDCYDNSVRYTDTLMGKMFSMLDNSRSSVMYFSDHGLIRNPQRAVVYSHGNVNPPERPCISLCLSGMQGIRLKDKQYTGEYNTTVC